MPCSTTARAVAEAREMTIWLKSEANGEKMLRTDVEDERRLGGADVGVASDLTVGLEGWLSLTGPAGADSVELLEALFTSSGMD